MANKIQIYRRVGAGAVGRPGALAQGELAYSEPGEVAGDANALFIGGNAAIQTLISNTRQVEMTGNQTVLGIKTFRDLVFGGAGTENTLPTVRPTANGQVLSGTTAGVVSWVTPSGALNERYIIAGAGATVQAAFDASNVTVNSDDLIIYEYQNQTFLYTGPDGAPVAGSTAGQFSALGTDYTLTATLNAGGAGSAAGIFTITEPDASTINIDIKGNVANGIPILDGAGLISMGQMPVSVMEFLGGYDASGGAVPGGTPTTGSFYIITVAGTIPVTANGTTNVATPVGPGDAIVYDDAAIAAAGGWWHIPAATGGTFQTAAQTPSTAVGDVVATDVQAAIAELDTEKLAKTPTANQTLTGTALIKTLLAGPVGVITSDGTVNQIDGNVWDLGTF